MAIGFMSYSVIYGFAMVARVYFTAIYNSTSVFYANRFVMKSNEK